MGKNTKIVTIQVDSSKGKSRGESDTAATLNLVSVPAELIGIEPNTAALVVAPSVPRPNTTWLCGRPGLLGHLMPLSDFDMTESQIEKVRNMAPPANQPVVVHGPYPRWVL